MTVTRVAKIMLLVVGLVIAVESRFSAQTSVAVIHLTSGWATFGQAVPQGLAHRALQVGSLPTQTDIKNRWPDGSIRFAVVTVNAPASGSYAVTAGTMSNASFRPVSPTASVTFTVGGVPYTATLPASGGGDQWLSGPLVDERRTTVAPIAGANGAAHPFLRVNFDTRLYNDGQARVDVSVENMLDVPGARTTAYDVVIAINATEVFRRSAVQHHHLTRWRKVFDLGSAPRATITPDVATFIAARALPAYLSSVTNVVSTATGARYDILREGAFPSDMRRERAEDAAPFPHWTARYLAHKDPRQRAFVLANGDLSGSWPVHLRQAAQSAARGATRDRLSPLVPDKARQPSIAFVPYLLTGDRYYAEEMAFWASDIGAPGNDARDIAWSLRNLADAAAFSPDGSPVKASLSEKVTNTLASLDESNLSLDARSVSPELNTLAYAIDRANKLGFTGGLTVRDQVAEAQLALSNSNPTYPSMYAAAAARLSLMIGAENGREGAQRAYDAVTVPELLERAGWALGSSQTETVRAAVDHSMHATAAAAPGDVSVGAAAATAPLPHNIADFGEDPSRTTLRSVQSGSWSSAATWSAGRVPGANEVVHVDPGHVVTIDNTSAVAYTVAVHGTLRFNRSLNTRLTVTNLMVMGDHGMPSMTTVGYLEVGTAAAPIAANVTAEIVIANTPIGNSVSDPEQFGTGLINLGKVSMHGTPMTPTWTRVAVEPRAGQTTLTLSETASGWKAGDRIVIPDTRHLAFNETNGWVNLQNQWEELTVQSVAADGRTITLTSPLQFNHLGARDLNGALEFLPHVGNLTRNVIVRSASATGTRGHTISVHIADTDIRYALFRDLGRTRFTPLNTTTNAVGRYPLHMHHNRGPLPSPANGYQFTLVGNAVDGGSAATQFKWGIAIHNSHYGLIQDNVVYNYNGSSIATEDGSESFNVFDHNFALRGMGEPDNSVSAARTALGTEGVGFWFRGPNNYVINNVAANFQNPTVEAAYGFVYQFRQTGSVPMPNFKGADPAVSGQFTSRNANNMPLLQFENNEAYGAMQGGLTFWWVGSLDPQPYADARESVIKDFSAWHIYNKTVYVYPSARVTLDGLKIRNAHSSNAHCCGNGVHFSDYSMSQIVIRNSDIQGSNSGIDAPSSGFGPAPNLLVENSFFRNWSNIGVPTPSSVNGCWMDNKLVVVRNSVFQAPPGRTLSAIGMGRAVSGAIECLGKLDEVRVYGYQGNANDNFQVYHSNTSVQPRPPGSCSPASKPGIGGVTCPIAPIGSPVPTVNLTASPTAIASGGSSTLSWTSTNATSVTINQGIGTVAASGSRAVSPAATTTYTITATNSSGSVTDSVTITVDSSPTATLSASPATINSGQSSTLTWTTSNATSVSISPGVGAVTASGSVTVSPGTTTTYTLTATNSSGSVTRTATVTVTTTTPPPVPTVTLGASPATITSGESTTLTWTSANASSVTIDQGIGTVAANGSRSVSPTATTTYTITAANSSGSVTATATVTVTTGGGGGGTSRTIGINFVGSSGVAMGPAEIAGVISAGNWNSATGADRTTPLALEDDAGAATGATAVWSSDNVWDTPIADQAGNNRMMKGYLDTGLGGATTVTVGGLANGTYDVYVYVDGDNGAGSRTGAYRISGTSITTTTINLTDPANASFNGTFAPANGSTGNFVKFTITATGFTLTATPGAASDGKPRAPINGIQIVPASGAPPPPPPPPAADFTIAASPATQTIAPGSAANYTVTVGALNGFTGSVTLSVTGLPANATASFAPSSVTGSGNATLTVTTSASTPGGTSTLTIRGTSGTLTHSTTVQLQLTVQPTGRAIGVNFVNDASDSMAATESAGVVAKPNWNNASGADRTTPLALIDETAAASGATITWSSDNVWETPITEQAGNRRLMKGYLDNGFGGATTITVAGLPQATYDIYVYVDGDNGTGSRTGAYRISGTGITTTTVNVTDAANTNFNATFVQGNNSAGNYVRFTVTATGFTVTATPGTASDGRPRAPVNGIQIVPR